MYRALPAVDWRTGAMSMPRDLYALVIRHPWLMQAFGSYVMYGPGKARHDDHSVAVFERAGFTGIDVDQDGDRFYVHPRQRSGTGGRTRLSPQAASPSGPMAMHRCARDHDRTARGRA